MSEPMCTAAVLDQPHTSTGGNESPAVSVVVSTFNRVDLLSPAIDRLVAQQTSVPYEIILVDNNSRDATRSVLEDAVRRHPDRVRAAFEGRQGVSHGRNKGIELSRAPVVAFTDDDVLVPPDWVELIARAMQASPDVSCVGGRVLPIWTNAPPAWLTRAHWSPLALVDYGDESFHVDRDRPVCLVTANVAYRRTALDAIGWFSPEFPRCQDHELLLRLWGAGYRALYLPSLVVTCDVPADRLEWKYHQRWHWNHGRLVARLPDEGGPGRAGSRSPRATLFGSPPAIYRQLATNFGAHLVSRALRRTAAARAAEAGARHRAAFIAARARLWRRERRNALHEVVRFVSAWASRPRAHE